MFDGSRELSEIIEDVARLGARLIIQTAVEAEVEVFLGRARYQRTAECPDARAGSRNGYCDSTIKTTAGPVTVARPKLRGTTEAFASQLFGKGVTKSNALESLVIAGLVRGLSVRDVENTLADALGAEAALSKSTVSRVCQAIGEEFEAWSSRRLDGLELDYLFLDASMFKMHPGARAELVLAAWGITTDGAPVFVALAAGGSESTDAWGDFLELNRFLTLLGGFAVVLGDLPPMPTVTRVHVQGRRRTSSAGWFRASWAVRPRSKPASPSPMEAPRACCGQRRLHRGLRAVGRRSAATAPHVG